MSVRSSVAIHFCAKNEIKDVMNFVGEYWPKKNHILSHNKPLMNWQYFNKAGQSYNFVIARDSVNGSVLSVLGYIPTQRYDPALTSINTIWLALWLSRDDADISGLGLMVYRFLVNNEDYEAIGVLGINSYATGIYEAMGYDLGILNQYYMLNKECSEFQIAVIPADSKNRAIERIKNRKKFIKVTTKNFKEISESISYVQPITIIPRKSPEYFYTRFLQHPIYNYHLYAILEHGIPQGIVALRCSNMADRCALRIVDYYGPVKGLLGTAPEFQFLMAEFEAEYCDMYNIGIGESILASAGFSKLNANSAIIIPNYFEPFEKRNVEIRYAIKSLGQGHYMLFKGDGDQDRPNIT